MYSADEARDEAKAAAASVAGGADGTTNGAASAAHAAADHNTALPLASFDGHGARGPVVHVSEGQTIEMTLTNGGAIAHSIDFHAARIAPNIAFRDAKPDESFTFRFTAGDPGVFMYHCGTKPVLAHIANGANRRRAEEGLTPADNEYGLVATEWYLNGDGIVKPASLDMSKRVR